MEWSDNEIAEDTEISTNTSVMGVKSFEPPGNGLKAVFVLSRPPPTG